MRHPQPLLVLSVAIAVGWWGWNLVTRSEAFRITELKLPAAISLDVPRSLIGQNLWTVDLNALATKLKAQQPHLKRLRVIRRLPRTLEIEVSERLPVAQLKLVHWYAVSPDGFILPEARPTPWPALTMLKGVEKPPTVLKVGRENTSDRLQQALRLVAALRRSPSLVGHQLTIVDVGNANHVSFVLDGEMEIRCGSEEELAMQLERLRTALQTVAKHQLDVRYIDVRFKDPVIGPKT